MLRHVILNFIGFVLVFITTVSFAKNINLYEEPKADAKIVGTIDPSKGIIPIFTPKEGDWVKVGNPSNGNVGWVKSSDMGQASATPSGFSFTQKIEKTGNGPETYVLKLGIPTQLTKEQTEAIYKQIQAQQAFIQQNIQKAMQDLFSNKKPESSIEIPFVMPVIVTPTNSSGTKVSTPTQTPSNQTK